MESSYSNLKALKPMFIGKSKRSSVKKNSSEEEKVRLNVKSWKNQIDLEQAAIKKLLIVEKKIRSYYELYSNETKKQRAIIGDILELAQRYMISIGIDAACQCPEVYKTTSEDVLLAEFNNKYQNLRESNQLLHSELQNVRCSYALFRAYSAQLDTTLHTPFVAGDAHHKPNAYFVELINDIISYIFSGLLKLEYQCELLDPVDLDTIDEYKTILNPSEEFEEYVLLGLAYCKCLQAKEVCVAKTEIKAPPPCIERLAALAEIPLATRSKCKLLQQPSHSRLPIPALSERTLEVMSETVRASTKSELAKRDRLNRQILE